MAIDDKRFTFTVKKGSDLLQRVPESSGQSARFSTLKPVDYPTPYEQMLTNSVQFSAMDKRHGAFFSIVVCTALSWSASPNRVITEVTGRRLL